ncbi:MAG: hypothetical protein K2X93_22965 [Candidatus Obscuribacterales bacterium]|nr:hypothetical protein [Candidatus Obscuribacterales bacterium]
MTMNSNAGANSTYDGIPTFKVGLPVILSNSVAQRVKWQATLQGTQTAASLPSQRTKQAPQLPPPAAEVSASKSEATLEKNEMQSRQATKSSSTEGTPKSSGADRSPYTSHEFDEQTLQDEHASDFMHDGSKDPYDVPMNYAYHSETLFDAYPDHSGALVDDEVIGVYGRDGYSNPQSRNLTRNNNDYQASSWQSSSRNDNQGYGSNNMRSGSEPNRAGDAYYGVERDFNLGGNKRFDNKDSRSAYAKGDRSHAFEPDNGYGMRRDYSYNDGSNSRYRYEDGFGGYGSTGGYMSEDGYGRNGSDDKGNGYSGYRPNSYGTNGTAKNGFGFTSSQGGYDSNPNLGNSSGYSGKNDASSEYGARDASGSNGYGANDYGADGYSSSGFSYNNDYGYASGYTSNGYRGTNDGKQGHIVPPGYETDSYMRYSGPSASDTRKPSGRHYAPAVYESSYPGSSQISMPLHSDLKSGDLQPSSKGKSKAKPKRRAKMKVGAGKTGVSTQPAWLPDVAIYDSGNGDALDYFSPISCEINERPMSRSCSYTRSASDKSEGTTHGAFAVHGA